MNGIEEILDQFDNTSAAWNSYKGRKVIADAEQEWIAKIIWKSLITLTFKDEIPEDIARKRFRRLVQILNKECFGNHYTRIVGHSYFSYVLGVELQKRGVIHFHMLVDKPVNFQLVHDYWNRSGYAWIDKVEDMIKAIRYVTKYVVKGGQLDHYFAKGDFIPKEKPSWWIE
jgi:hypothetical protein